MVVEVSTYDCWQPIREQHSLLLWWTVSIPLRSGSSLFSRMSLASVPSSIRSSLVITPMVLRPEHIQKRLYLNFCSCSESLCSYFVLFWVFVVVLCLSVVALSLAVVVLCLCSCFVSLCRCFSLCSCFESLCSCFESLYSCFMSLCSCFESLCSCFESLCSCVVSPWSVPGAQ